MKNKFYVLADLAQYPAATAEEIAERQGEKFDTEQDAVTVVKTCLGQAKSDGDVLQYHGQGGVRGRGGEVAEINREVEEEMWCLTQKGYDKLKDIWQDLFPIYNELVDSLSIGARFVPPHVLQGDSHDES